MSAQYALAAAAKALPNWDNQSQYIVGLTGDIQERVKPVSCRPERGIKPCMLFLMAGMHRGLCDGKGLSG